ncbi:MAG: zf-HC2 domain-containing protein [Deltaproteobacteria bacterium]|nr:zf-HC2 domain-containing protein [Deltaproteobacteria bacterium]
MNCDDIQKGIYVYLDGEFAEPERVDFEEHITACARCRKRVERERGFLVGVRHAVPQVAAPPGLEERIKRALAEAPPPEEVPVARPRPAGRSRFWLAAAATLLVSGGLAAWQVVAGGGGGDAVPERIAQEAVATHQSQLPMEVRGSLTQIRRFLEGNVPFRVDLAFADDPRVELVGARFTRVDGRDAVLLNYEVDGERLSVLQVAADSAEAEAAAPAEPELAPSFATQAGFDVATFKRRGVVSSVVGAGGTGNVQRLVRAAYSR